MIIHIEREDGQREYYNVTKCWLFLLCLIFLFLFLGAVS